ITIPDIHQIAILVNFKAIDSKCPPLKNQSLRLIEDQWMVGFLLKGVHSVFKRWYLGHCHLQLMLKSEIVDSIYQNYLHSIPMKETEWCRIPGKNITKWEYDVYPWKIIFDVVNHIFKEPFNTIAEMISAISVVNHKYLSVNLLKVRIHKSEF